MKKLKSIDQTPWKNPIHSTSQYRVFEDKVPVTEGHRLYVPLKETEFYIGICLLAALDQGNEWVSKGYCTGFNIGMNCGSSAGQTVGWPHVHLIPRRNGDMDDPRGGVRHVIPDRGNYKTSPHYKDIKL